MPLRRETTDEKRLSLHWGVAAGIAIWLLTVGGGAVWLYAKNDSRISAVEKHLDWDDKRIDRLTGAK